MLAHLRDKQSLADGEKKKKIFDVQDRYVSVHNEYNEEDLGEVSFLNGYDQTNSPPSGYDPDDLENCSVVAEIHKGQEAFKKVVAHIIGKDGGQVNWNLNSLPFHRKASNKKDVVFMVLHYQTTDELNSQILTNFEGQLMSQLAHTARSRRSDGSLRSFTPGYLSASVGPELFNEMVYGDMIPFAHPKGGSPLDILSAKDYSFVMKSWVKHVLLPMHKHERIVIALCSKGTEDLYAKHVVGGNAKLAKSYKANPNKYVSATEGALTAAYHPSSIYDPKHWSHMGMKTRMMDQFMTNAKRRATGDENAKECEFSRNILDLDSEAFELLHRRYLAGCALGGRTAQAMTREAAYHYAICREDGYTHKEAMDWIENEMEKGLEHRNLLENQQRFTATSQLASRMGVDNVSDEEVAEIATELGMNPAKLHENVEAMLYNWDRFSTISNLASRMQNDDVVSDEEIAETAALYDMKPDKLRKDAESFICNWNRFATIAQLASRMGVDNVSDEEVAEIATELGMNPAKLHENVEAFLSNWNDPSFTVVAEFASKVYENLLLLKDDHAVKAAARDAGLNMKEFVGRVEHKISNWNSKKDAVVVYENEAIMDILNCSQDDIESGKVEVSYDKLKDIKPAKVCSQKQLSKDSVENTIGGSHTRRNSIKEDGPPVLLRCGKLVAFAYSDKRFGSYDVLKKNEMPDEDFERLMKEVNEAGKGLSNSHVLITLCDDKGTRFRFESLRAARGRKQDGIPSSDKYRDGTFINEAMAQQAKDGEQIVGYHYNPKQAMIGKGWSKRYVKFINKEEYDRLGEEEVLNPNPGKSTRNGKKRKASDNKTAQPTKKEKKSTSGKSTTASASDAARATKNKEKKDKSTASVSKSKTAPGKKKKSTSRNI